jgi:mRNA-degrading endonuclease RelE of RelBE toxin-antitoxin system
MSSKIEVLANFEKDVKKLYKKYKKLPEDLKTLKNTLKDNPKAGIELGNKCYKIRLANSSVPIGKSGGFRVVYYYLDEVNNIYLMTIYSKSDLENIDDKKILEILEESGL